MFLMLPAPPGLSSREGKGGGVDAITTLGAWSAAGEHGSKRGAFYQMGNETVQATIWGMSSPATSVKRMFRPL